MNQQERHESFQKIRYQIRMLDGMADEQNRNMITPESLSSLGGRCELVISGIKELDKEIKEVMR